MFFVFSDSKHYKIMKPLMGKSMTNNGKLGASSVRAKSIFKKMCGCLAETLFMAFSERKPYKNRGLWVMARAKVKYGVYHR